MFIGDFEDYIIEPSEFEKVVEEMKDKLHDLIKDEAKKMMEDYKQMDEEFIELKIEVDRKKMELEKLEKEIEDMEAKYEQADIMAIPKKYMDRIVSYYTGDFIPGDRVFITDSRSSRVECDKCHGKKKIKAIIDGEEIMIKCVKCKGYGAVADTVMVIEEREIDSVYLKLGFHEDRVGLWSSDCVYVRGRDYATRPEYIYRSYEEAEKALGKLTGGLSNED